MENLHIQVYKDNGDLGAEATITVYEAGTTNLATIYSDDGNTQKSNPFTADSLGRGDFFAADGKYDIEISGTGITTYKLENVLLLDIKIKNYPIDFTAVWASGYTGKMHFQVQISENADFSSPIVDAESKNDNTSWFYSNGLSFVSLPAEGLAAAYDGNRVFYKVTASLKRGTLYYVRVRQYEVDNAVYGDWILKPLMI